MVGVILAAGDGTRLKRSKNEPCCKPLVQLNSEPLIAYALDNLLNLNVSKAYIVIGKEGNMIKSVLGDEYKGIKLTYVCQQEQIGLVNAFTQALNVMDCDEPVVLQLSDEVFMELDADLIKNLVEKNEFDFYCGITSEENPEKIKNNFSVETDNNSVLVKCIEKPKAVINDIKGTGFSIFSGETQKIIRETYNSQPEKLYDLCDCFNYLTESSYHGKAFYVAKKEFNINTLSDLTEAENFLK